MKIPVFGFSNNFDKNWSICVRNNGFCCYNVGDIVINELKIRQFGDRIGNFVNNLFAQDTYNGTNKYHNAETSNRSVKNFHQQFCHKDSLTTSMLVVNDPRPPFSVSNQKIWKHFFR